MQNFKAFKSSLININNNHLKSIFAKNGDQQAPAPVEDKKMDIAKLPLNKFFADQKALAIKNSEIQNTRTAENHKHEILAKKKELATEPEQPKENLALPENPKHVEQQHKADLALKMAKVSTEKARAKAVLRKRTA